MIITKLKADYKLNYGIEKMKLKTNYEIKKQITKLTNYKIKFIDLQLSEIKI